MHLYPQLFKKDQLLLNQFCHYTLNILPSKNNYATITFYFLIKLQLLIIPASLIGNTSHQDLINSLREKFLCGLNSLKTLLLTPYMTVLLLPNLIFHLQTTIAITLVTFTNIPNPGLLLYLITKLLLAKLVANLLTLDTHLSTTGSVISHLPTHHYTLFLT